MEDRDSKDLINSSRPGRSDELALWCAPKPVVAGLVACSGIAVAMAVARVWYTGEDTFSYLIWNLALAWLPVLCATLASANGMPRLARMPLIGIWFTLLPNAPYVVTDYVHLAGRHVDVQSAYDVALITAFATTGLGLALWSVRIVDRRLLNPARRLQRIAVMGAILSGMSVGVYLGRAKRLHSWDMLVSPGKVARLAWEGPLAGRGLAFCAVFAVAFAALYVLLGRVNSSGVKARLRQSGTAA